jgi:hypothetical protein
MCWNNMNNIDHKHDLNYDKLAHKAQKELVDVYGVFTR